MMACIVDELETGEVVRQALKHILEIDDMIQIILTYGSQIITEVYESEFAMCRSEKAAIFLVGYKQGLILRIQHLQDRQALLLSFVDRLPQTQQDLFWLFYHNNIDYTDDVYNLMVSVAESFEWFDWVALPEVEQPEALMQNELQIEYNNMMKELGIVVE